MSKFFEVAKFFHKIVVQYSAGILQYMQYIFVMGATYNKPYQRPQKGWNEALWSTELAPQEKVNPKVDFLPYYGLKLHNAH